MELLRTLWAEARHRILLWALGSLLFTAITAGLGLRGTFSASATRGKPGSTEQVRKEAPPPDKGW